MALFGLKKKDEQKDAKPAASKTVVAKAKTVKAPKPAKAAKPTVVATAGSASVNAGSGSLAGIILRPRVTEKSGLLSQSGVYTFEVSLAATKSTVSRAVKAMYKVTPVRVAMINLPAKKVFVRGRHGSVAGIRKAMVTVKKGEKIDFV